tara:strand:+ start:739 stop:1161 length:423 start_codon:yes stop_codon:yes gene_type:complete
MALLFYSDRCSHSSDLLKWLDKHPGVSKLVRRHDVTIHGIPAKFRNTVKSVPTIVTQQGQMMVGKQCSAWVNSLIPPQEVGGLGGYYGLADLSDESGGKGMFSLDNYGQSIQPQITAEMEERINSTVTDAYQAMQTSLKE